MLKKLQSNLIGKNLRFYISGGGYLSEKTAYVINGLNYPLYNGYGMTEIGVTSVEQSPNVEDRMRCHIGKPFNGVEYKIVPSDPANPNVGELLIKSKAIHIREIIGGKERAADIDAEGYFHSGDIAERFEDGSFAIKGRIKDIIINADGENIFPDELELYFKKVNHVTNLSILGVKKKDSTNESIVLVLEIENSTTNEEFEALKVEVQEIAKNLPKGTKLDDIYIAKGKLPVANNMKVKRFVIKDAIASGSDDYISINAKKEEKHFENLDPAQVEKVREPLREAFSRILYLPKVKIEDNAHWINDLGGDSMSYVELLQFVEAEFDVKIPEELYGQLTCINDFVEEIIKLQNKK